MNDVTKKDAFKHYGIKLSNSRWSTSGRSPDGKFIVLALWTDLFRWRSKPVYYDGSSEGTKELWKNDAAGNRERLTNLIWARDHCAGQLRPIWVRAKDPEAPTREMEDAWTRDDLRMRIVDINEQTGEFRSIVIEGGDT